MADLDAQDSSNRATVAQTLAEVRGLRDLVKAETSAIQRQLDTVADLPSRMAKIEEKVEALDERERDSDANMARRVDALENNQTGNRDWRRSQLPIIILTIFLALAGIAQVIVAFSSHP